MYKVYCERKGKIGDYESVYIAYRKDRENKDEVFAYDLKGTLSCGRTEILKTFEKEEDAKDMLCKIFKEEKYVLDDKPILRA